MDMKITFPGGKKVHAELEGGMVVETDQPVKYGGDGSAPTPYALFLASIGFFMLLAGVGAQTLIQNAVPAEIRARVISLFILLSWGLPAIGALIMGWAATYFGLQATIAFGAALAVPVWFWARGAGKIFAPRLEANADEQTIASR